MKERIGCVIPVVLLVAFFSWAHYRNVEKREAQERGRRAEAESREMEKRRHDDERSRIKESFQELARRHNAILDWSGVHKKGNAFQQVFTIELQDAQQRLGDRPAIFVSRVSDIFRTKDGFCIICDYEPLDEHLVYEASGFPMTAAKVTFLLEVHEAMARHLVQLHGKSKNEVLYDEPVFAIVALVKRTTLTLRPEHSAVGEIIEAKTYDVERRAKAEVEEGGLRPRVLMTGICLEIVHLEGYDRH